MMKHFVLALAASLPMSVAAQPFSESMADCAALYQNAAQWVSSDDAARNLMFAANQWAVAATAQTKREGRPLSQSALWSKIDTKTAEWEAKGPQVFLSQDFRDWTGYCKSFAKDRGIRLEP